MDPIILCSSVWACFCSQLIEGGADLDAEDDSKRTPLYYAAKTHETQMIKLLLDTEKVDPRVIADADSRRHGHKPPGIYKRAEIVSQLRWNKEVGLHLGA